jgi:hypothetical protein
LSPDRSARADRDGYALPSQQRNGTVEHATRTAVASVHFGVRRSTATTSGDDEIVNDGARRADVPKPADHGVVSPTTSHVLFWYSTHDATLNVARSFCPPAAWTVTPVAPVIVSEPVANLAMSTCVPVANATPVASGIVTTWPPVAPVENVTSLPASESASV